MRVSKSQDGIVTTIHSRFRPVALKPWEENPYGLISWWSMQKFSAQNFYRIGLLLRGIRSELDGYDEGFPYKAKPATDPAIVQLNKIEEDCKNVGLMVSAKSAVRASSVLMSGDGRVGTIRELVSTLEHTIESEMESHLFFHVPQSQADFYDQKEMFGKNFELKFPSIQFDMVEAGNCYALGRGTACVFHLMRIMETGVQALGVKLGVTLANEKNWQVILDGVNKVIGHLDSKAPATAKLSQAAASLYAVKLAWRNPVMHPKDTYTPEEAKDLIQFVKAFMGHLAGIV